MKKICVVTGTRAEFGLLSPLMKQFKENKNFQQQIIVTGMHLSPEFGLTYKQIENEGYTIDEKVELLLSSDSKIATVKSTGLGLISFPDVYERLQPDLIIVVGDRYEILSAVIAGYFLNIPIAHLHGGETTEGAIDEGIRHAITKMAYLHFTSLETYRKRVIQLGESPERVFNVGAIGLDTIKNTDFMTLEMLSKSLDINLKSPFLLITYHPETISDTSEEEQMEQFFKALDNFPSISLLFTLPNSDAGGRKIISLINEFAQQRDNAYVFSSLGQKRYFSAVKLCEAVIGNSSSGIIEVPSFHKPTINIGARQKGRVAADSVINCQPSEQSITNSLQKALGDDFKKLCETVINPYGDGETTEKIIKVITEQINEINLKKEFFNIEYSL